MEEVCLICLILLIIDFKRQKEFSIISKIISNIFKFENSHTLQLQNVMYHIGSGFLDNLINIFWGSTRITHFSLILISLLKSFFLNIFCPFEQLLLLFLFIEIRFSTKVDVSTNNFKEITFFTSSCHAIAILLIHKKILFHSWFPVNMKY